MAQFEFNPDFGAQVAYNPAVKRVKFGDGYEQRAKFGINTNPQVWTLKFQNRDETETNAIEDFLKSKEGVSAFTWRPPRATADIKVVCDSWTVEAVKFNLNTINATFRQVFQP